MQRKFKEVDDKNDLSNDLQKLSGKAHRFSRGMKANLKKICFFYKFYSTKFEKML